MRGVLAPCDAVVATQFLTLNSAASRPFVPGVTDALRYRQRVLIQNLGPNAIYFAETQAKCTVNAGIRIPPAASGVPGQLDLPLGPSVYFYLFAATADQVAGADTRILEMGG